MRPRKLEMEAFGPYAGSAEIDFTRLEDVFLVCGDTGSGKTSIFDALTYALYGSAPGTRSSNDRDLVSHHAPPGGKPRVAFEFDLSGEQWRVERTLTHDMPKQRGPGMREIGASASLWRRSGGVWNEIAGKVTETNDEIARRLAFSKDEFSKIVLLPQGQFQQFLEMKSNDRSIILEKIFPVDLHAATSLIAQNRFKTLENEIKNMDTEIGKLSNLGDQEAIATRLAAFTVSLEAARERRAACRNAETEAQARLRESTRLARAFASLEESRALLARFDAEEPAFQERDARLKRAKEARRLRALMETGTRRRHELEEALESAQASRRELELMEDNASQVDAQRKRILALVVLIPAASLKTANLERFSSAAHRLSDAQAQAAAAEKTFLALDAMREDRATAITEAKSVLTGMRPSAQLETGLRDKLEESRALLERSRQGLANARQAEALRAERSRFEGMMAEHGIALTSANKTLLEAKAALAAVERERDGEAAAALALHLTDGNPCPVCGSCTHPLPASLGVSSLDCAGRLTLSRTRHENAIASVNRIQAGLEASQNDRDRCDKTLANMEGEYGHVDSPDNARIASTNAQEKFDAAKRGLESLEKAKAAARDKEAELLRMEAEQDLGSEKHRQATEERTTLAAHAHAAREELKRLSADFNDSDDPDSLLSAERKNLESLNSEKTRLEQSVKAYDAKLSTLNTSLNERQAEAGRRKEQLEADSATLSRELASSGFKDSSDADAAMLDDAAITAGDAELAAHALRHANARARAETEGNALKGQTPPDADAAEKAREAAATALIQLESADSEYDRLQREEASYRLESDRLHRLLEQRNKLSLDSGTLSRLAHLLNGDISGRRVNFKTFALSRYFSEVVQRATIRLGEMSDGRYRLAMDQDNRGGSGRIGLEVKVLDSYTGRERSSSTLSGGEKFLASISLALGLADTVSARSGGVATEAIFIDEGFGSLDDEALDRAIAVLDLAREGRMVGIVSHVAELKNRISSRVEVRKGRSGSTIRIV